MSSVPVEPFPRPLARPAARTTFASQLPPFRPEPRRSTSLPVTSPVLTTAFTPDEGKPATATQSAIPNVRRALAYRIRLPLTAVCIVSGVALSVLTRPWLAADSAGGLALTGLGMTFVVAGIAVRLWALASIGLRKTKQLVTTGPYSLTRNPLYLGTLLIVLGFLALWQSPVLAALVVPPILLYPFGVVPAEERVLRGEFGAEFDAYCVRTPRWWPRLRGYVAERQLATGTPGFRREAQCGVWWMFFAAVTIAVVALRGV